MTPPFEWGRHEPAAPIQKVSSSPESLDPMQRAKATLRARLQESISIVQAVWSQVYGTEEYSLDPIFEDSLEVPEVFISDMRAHGAQETESSIGIPKDSETFAFIRQLSDEFGLTRPEFVRKGNGQMIVVFKKY